MVYRLTLAYRGTAYSGWQRQPNAVTIQAVVEEALEEMLGVVVPIIGAGRTDAGVHARGQVAHLELDRPTAPRELVHGLNHFLPEDIRVLDAGVASPQFHARKSALSKLYSYRLTRVSVVSPLDSLFAVRVEPSIDVEAIVSATELLAGKHDFTAFALAGGSHRRPVRTVLEASWSDDLPELTFRIVGDGFLRGMVRSIVGTLLEVGRGRRSPDDLARLLSGVPRSEAGPTAPAKGLVLEGVHYEHQPEEGIG